MKRIRLKPCDDLDGASQWDKLEKLGTPKKKMKHLNWEFFPWRTPEEGINHLEETRIRIMLCISFTNLDWWQTTDFTYYFFSLKRIKVDIAQTWEDLQPTTGMILEITNELIW